MTPRTSTRRRTAPPTRSRRDSASRSNAKRSSQLARRGARRAALAVCFPRLPSVAIVHRPRGPRRAARLFPCRIPSALAARREDVRRADVVGSVGQERQVPGALHGDGEAALVAGAGAGLPPGLDLAAVRDEAAELERVLVVDVLDLVDAEGADLAAASEAAAAAPAAAGRAGSLLGPAFGPGRRAGRFLRRRRSFWLRVVALVRGQCILSLPGRAPASRHSNGRSSGSTWPAAAGAASSNVSMRAAWELPGAPPRKSTVWAT